MFLDQSIFSVELLKNHNWISIEFCEELGIAQ